MPTAKRAYRVLPNHRDEVAGVEVVTGQIVYLTDAEALYERDLGYIEPTDATAAPSPPPPFLETDTIILSRGGATRVILADELAAFFAPALGEFPGDLRAPVITVSAIQIMPSGTAIAIALAANEAVTWTKTGGADAALFQLAGATLSLSPQDYASPADADGDNTYVVEVTATDTVGHPTPKTIKVMVSAPATVPPVSGGPADLTTDFDDEANLALKSSLGT